MGLKNFNKRQNVGIVVMILTFLMRGRRQSHFSVHNLSRPFSQNHGLAKKFKDGSQNWDDFAHTSEGKNGKILL